MKQNNQNWAGFEDGKMITCIYRITLGKELWDQRKPILENYSNSCDKAALQTTAGVLTGDVF